MAKSCLVVRAEVAEKADRDRFDHWYATDHLMPLAIKIFGARAGLALLEPRIRACSSARKFSTNSA